MPATVSDSLGLAIDHTKQQLFTPFRIGQWTRLALVGLLAGELGSNGCNFQVPGRTGATPHPQLGIDPALLVPLIVAGVIVALAIGIALMYVSSVMRFVLFDSIVTRECRVRSGWRRRVGPGRRFFVWSLLYTVLTMTGVAILLGFPLAFAYAAGWLTQPKEHLLPLVLGGIVLLFLLLAFCVGAGVVFVLTKDFVVPQMALEGLGAMEAWRRLWTMMKAEKGAYAGYVGMKIVLGLAAAIAIGIVAVIVALILAAPVVGLALAGRLAGLAWNAHTIALAVVAGCIWLAAFVCLVSLISVPAIVFFPAYSVHFFAGRYPPLEAALVHSADVS